MKNFKFLALALAAVMGVTFTACDKNNGAEGGDTPTPPAATCEAAMAVLDIWLSDSALGLLECGFVYTDGTSEELQRVVVTDDNSNKGFMSFTPVDVEAGYPEPVTLNHYRLEVPVIELPGSFKYRFDFHHKEEPDMSYVTDGKCDISFYCEATVIFDNEKAVRKFEPQHKSGINYAKFAQNNLNLYSTGWSVSLETDATASYQYFSRQ